MALALGNPAFVFLLRFVVLQPLVINGYVNQLSKT